MNPYQKTVLSNGLRIISHPMKDRNSAAVGFWVGAGGRFEDDRIKGAAHFLEHILFKGSKKYSCGEIKERIEGVGGSLNAFTSEEQTCYFAKIPHTHLELTMDILGDMVFHPLITKADVEKESGVIIEEIKMYHDLPQSFVMELLDELMWPNHPLGKNLAGSVESISRMTHEDLRQFQRTHYSSSNVVLAASGHLEHKTVVAWAEKRFGKLKSNSPQGFLEASDQQDRPQIKFFRKEIEQMHLALGMVGLHYDHKDRYILAILNVILGGNMSSRLFDEVREKRGLAYSISSAAKFLKDTGLFMVRAGVDNKKIVEALQVILQELEKIRQSQVSRGELTRAKDYLLGQLQLGLEDTLDHMLWIGESMISLDRVRKLEEIMRDVKRVTLKDVQRVANEILNRTHYNLSLVGPLTDDQEKDIRRLVE